MNGGILMERQGRIAAVSVIVAFAVIIPPEPSVSPVRVPWKLGGEPEL